MRWALLFCAAACYQHAAASSDAPAQGPDSRPMPDAQLMDAPPYCVQPSLLPQICVGHVRSMFDGSSALDTTDPSKCDAVVPRSGQADLCVIAADTVSLTSSTYFSATGSRALVLIAKTTINIDNSSTIDVSAKSNGTMQGAGVHCAAMAGGSNGTSQGGGGGAGGSWMSSGGNGGTNSSGTSGGAALTGMQPPPFDAGCDGGKGGDSTGAGGHGGHAGGALYLYAPTIAVSGTILALGGGGGGGAAATGSGGGGGGGSGGMIVLDGGLVLTSNTLLVATGGGAGGAGGSSVNGFDGGTTSLAAPSQGGTGGASGGPSAGDGGQGSATTLAAGDGISGVNDGGGGGGGGAGSIRMPMGIAAAGRIFPSATQ